ncbi:tryptophan synthase subunit alpha [Haliea sp. AH-315-K21]|uniref:Tryptophan synthase alpha chain n=1 Tax=SAR86 cluster bacterium TaxID=2030880 RepID=A0A2A5CF96_9GAMM|nr:tryptophan synthase subunit alpha [Haliea sp. AH-315-K21]MBN4059786.1 tryptophan synthase subunit alpha [bacterium AH-315-I11]MBN4075190.1 tryptophan synthase subunit alpha [Gammaproteobacteria bacterium AH-315-E17]PCJ42140.1 MAG: tryptophan synthase subunit alpha [SAR86 cluster bacterium]
MSRIEKCFKQLKRQNKKAFIPYLTAGDPNIETSLNLMHALVQAGADIIELGYPFSDPSSDGPVIQRAVERSLAKHTSLKGVLALVKRFREENQDTPLVLMGYLNPIECMGYQKFAEDAEAAGVDGVLVVDMPPEEAHDLLQIIHRSELDCIFLVAPTTHEARARKICELSSGYVYYVSLKGVTGASHLDIDSVRTNVNQLKSYCELPIAIGFGIKDAETAAKLGELADAIIVGSALVSLIAELKDGHEYSRDELSKHIALMAGMRAALDRS